MSLSTAGTARAQAPRGEVAVDPSAVKVSAKRTSGVLCETFSVTTAEAHDSASVKALTSMLHGSCLGEAQAIPELPSLPQMLDEIANRHETFLLCRLSGRLAGVLSYGREGAGLNISRLAVSPAFYRRRVASALLHHLLKGETQATMISVNTGADNRSVIGCYRSLGFHIERRWATPDGLAMVTLIKA
jgi:ribosomal protein S18 acetylase RimI-like enzyme